MDPRHEGDNDVMAGDNASQPLKGIVICCTNVPDEKRVSLIYHINFEEHED